MLMCEIYALVTLSITTVWVYSAKDYSIETLALVMFFPGLFAPWFSEDPYFFYSVLGIGKIAQAFVYSIVAVICVLVAMAMTLTMDICLGWGKLTGQQTWSQLISTLSSELLTPRNLSIVFLRAAGEEIGWRCYLLPSLLAYYPTNNALLYSGVVWGLFHVPVMVLLTGRLDVTPRWGTVVVQLMSCVVYSHVCGWIAIQSSFSLWAPTVFHATWNNLVPLVFGSIYTQEPGEFVTGRQFIINPEGVAGSISGCLMVLILSWNQYFVPPREQFIL